MKNEQECQCDWCQNISKPAEEAMKSRDPDKLINILTICLNHICQIEFDLDHENAIADGSWPSAVEILEKRLVNAVKVRAENETQQIIKADNFYGEQK